MKLILTITIFGSLFFISQVQATNMIPSEIKIINIDGVVQKKFSVFSGNNPGGASVDAGDLGGDGIAEIIAGAGVGNEPLVKIFRQDGSLINSFLAYSQSFDRGINVAIGDVNGDDINEIITGPGYGGGPHVKVFNGRGESLGSFFAYEENFRGGVFVTARDINNDGKAEIITGSGPTGGPHVKIFDENGNIKSQFFAFDANDTSGVTVGTADMSGDGTPEILVSRASSDPPLIKIFTPNGNEIGSINAFDNTFTGGITAIGQDFDNDGKEEILVSPNGGNANIKIFETNGGEFKIITPFGSNFDGAIKSAAAELNPNQNHSIIVSPSRPIREGSIAVAKSIMVDVSEQRLYAFENGLLKNTFLVSTGITLFPTPIGEFSVLKKVPIKDYVWTYGAGSPFNYALRNVKWNLEFKRNFYLHYAYWHNNFGKRKSHGCVNMNLPSSEWIYDWGEVGTPVKIQN